MTVTYHTLDISIQGTVYSVSLPNGAYRPQEIIVRDHNGLIVVLEHNERAEVLEIYGFVQSLGDSGNIIANVQTLTSAFIPPNLVNEQIQSLSSLRQRIETEVGEILDQNAFTALRNGVTEYIETIAPTAGSILLGAAIGLPLTGPASAVLFSLTAVNVIVDSVVRASDDISFWHNRLIQVSTAEDILGKGSAAHAPDL